MIAGGHFRCGAKRHFQAACASGRARDGVEIVRGVTVSASEAPEHGVRHRVALCREAALAEFDDHLLTDGNVTSPDGLRGAGVDQ